MRGIAKKTKVYQATDPKSVSATETSAAIDLGVGADRVLLISNVGAFTGGTTPSVTAKLQHCATSGGTYADVGDAAAAQSAAGVATVEVGPVKRFVKVVQTVAGGPSGVLVGATIVASGLRKPVSSITGV